MGSSEDTAWVFDSLIGFLHGPIWNAPLQTFVEEKSTIFEPTENGQLANKKEYMAIFQEYKNMVDLMLGSYMDDMGITPDQFEDACQMSKNNVDGLPSHFHKRLFEQIWAANDFNIFTRMMTQKNVELQIQALELIEQNGIIPDSYISFESNTEIDEDADIMNEVKRISFEENKDFVTEQISDINAIEDLHQEKEYLKNALESFQIEPDSQIENNVKEELNIAETTLYKIEKHNNKQPIQPKPLQEDVLKRQQYLKQQRDKLLTLKRQIREKQLNESSEDVSDTMRPKSATAAKFVLAGNSIGSENVQNKSLQLRKALAERLRSEVVKK